MISITTISMLIVSYIWISGEYRNFSVSAQRMKVEYIESQKAAIKNEVDKVIDYIEYKKSLTERRLKRKVRERVYEAWSVAGYIFEQNRDKMNPDKIKETIHDALFSMRWDEGRGYYFVPDTDGIMRIHANNPELENSYVYDLKDTRGKYLIREFIEIAVKNGEGYSKYYWKKPGNDVDMFPKYSYVKLFEPLNWIIGTGEYLDTVEKDIQREALERIEKIRFGKNGYVFVVRFDGLVLAHGNQKDLVTKNLWNIEDLNGVKFIQEQWKVVQNPEGGFLRYTWNKPTTNQPASKITFARGLPEWEWMIGAGVYVDEIDGIIAEKEIAMRKHVMGDISQMALQLSIIFIAAVLITIFVSNRIKRELNIFIEFFKKSTYQNEKISDQKLSILEFQTLSTYTNRMIDERRKSDMERERAQAELKRSEETSRALLNATSDAAILVDTDGVILASNQNAFNLYKLPTEHIKGKSFPDYLPSESAELRKTWGRKVIKTGDPARFEDVDGKRHFSHTVYPVFSAEGVVERLAIFSRDITEQKQAEKVLKKSREEYRALYEESHRKEQLYRGLLNSSADAVIIYDTKGNALYVNPAFTRIFGWKPEEVIGMRIDFVPESERNATMAKIQSVYEGSIVSDWETKRLTRAGDLLNISLSCSIYHDLDGAPAGFIVIQRDITGRKKAEVALRQSREEYRNLYEESYKNEQLYRSLLNSSADAVIIYDLEGNTVFVNPAFTRIFGWKPDEVMGKRIDFVPESEKNVTTDIIRSVYKGDLVTGRHSKRSTKHGSLLDVSLSASLYYDQNGSPAGSIVIQRDITDRKKAESKLADELVKFQALYELALNMAISRGLKESLDLVAETARKLLGADAASISLVEEATGLLCTYTCSGMQTDAFSKIRTPEGVGIGGTVFSTGKPVVLEDNYRLESIAYNVDICRMEGLVSTAAVPIQTGQTRLGVLYAFNRQASKFSKVDVDTLSLLGHLAAIQVTRTQARMAT